MNSTINIRRGLMSMKARFWRDGWYRASTSDEVGSFANYSETLETVSFPHGVKLQKSTGN